MAADVAPYCFTHGQVGWYFEQMLANSGGLYFNNDNGRTGRATEVRLQQRHGRRGLHLPDQPDPRWLCPQPGQHLDRD